MYIHVHPSHFPSPSTLSPSWKAQFQFHEASNFCKLDALSPQTPGGGRAHFLGLTSWRQGCESQVPPPGGRAHGVPESHAPGQPPRALGQVGSRPSRPASRANQTRNHEPQGGGEAYATREAPEALQ